MREGRDLVLIDNAASSQLNDVGRLHCTHYIQEEGIPNVCGGGGGGGDSCKGCNGGLT